MEEHLLFFARDSSISDDRVYKRLHRVEELLVEHNKVKSLEKLKGEPSSIAALFVYNELVQILKDPNRKLYNRLRVCHTKE